MDEEMKIFIVSVNENLDDIEYAASSLAKKIPVLKKHISGLRKAAEKDGLKGLVGYTVNHRIKEHVNFHVINIVVELLERIKPKPSDLIKLLDDANPKALRTAGFYIMVLLNRGVLDQKEFRESKEFNAALEKMRTMGSGLEMLARVLENQAGMMKSNPGQKTPLIKSTGTGAGTGKGKRLLLC